MTSIPPLKRGKIVERIGLYNSILQIQRDVKRRQQEVSDKDFKGFSETFDDPFNQRTLPILDFSEISGKGSEAFDFDQRIL